MRIRVYLVLHHITQKQSISFQTAKLEKISEYLCIKVKKDLWQNKNEYDSIWREKTITVKNNLL